MRATEATADARRAMEVCNACRYCEGFCAVFPALERKRSFAEADLSYLANLCHNCRGCFYACQYAPPHEWGINVPRTLAAVRGESYAEYAWPQPLASLFRRNGLVVSLATALGIALVLWLTAAIQAPGGMAAARPVAPGSFYGVIPLWAMMAVALLAFGFAVFALYMGAMNFWRDAGVPGIDRSAAGRAAWDVLTLKNLGGGGHGCNDNSERFSMKRRWLHHGMFYGFLLCFAATTVAAVYHDILGWAAPYPFASVPVLLGTVGGVLLLAGTVGLFAMKLVDDPQPAARHLLGADVALLALLALAAATGLLLLALRGTGAMPALLAVHLGVILSLFLLLPYSKMVHGVYRTAALLRNAIEARRATINPAE